VATSREVVSPSTLPGGIEAWFRACLLAGVVCGLCLYSVVVVREMHPPISDRFLIIYTWWGVGFSMLGIAVGAVKRSRAQKLFSKIFLVASSTIVVHMALVDGMLKLHWAAPGMGHLGTAFHFIFTVLWSAMFYLLCGPVPFLVGNAFSGHVLKSWASNGGDERGEHAKSKATALCLKEFALKLICLVAAFGWVVMIFTPGLQDLGLTAFGALICMAPFMVYWVLSIRGCPAKETAVSIKDRAILPEGTSQIENGK